MSLSAHVLAVNAAGVVGRAVRSLSGIVDEVVLVDAGSVDGTPDVVGEVCREVGADFKLVPLSPSTHPDLFMRDDPSTWRREVPGPFSGLQILRRFDLARNLGLAVCGCPYVVKIDADDEVLDPAGILKVCEFLDAESSVGVVLCPYEVTGWRGKVFYARVWRAGPDVHFNQAIHEHLIGSREVSSACSTMGLVVDRRDCRGQGSRVAHRNYKVFRAEYERREAASEVLDRGFLLSTLADVPDRSLAVELVRRAASVR